MIDYIWNSNHGHPRKMYFDSELINNIFLHFLKQNSVEPRVIPLRTHKKLRVEPKKKYAEALHTQDPSKLS